MEKTFKIKLGDKSSFELVLSDISKKMEKPCTSVSFKKDYSLGICEAIITQDCFEEMTKEQIAELNSFVIH